MQRRRPSGTAAPSPIDEPKDAGQALENAWNQWRADREEVPDSISFPDEVTTAPRPAPRPVDTVEPPAAPPASVAPTAPAAPTKTDVAAVERELAALTATVESLNRELATNRDAIDELRRRIEDLHHLLAG